MITDIEEVKELLARGHGRTYIEKRLGLSKAESHRVIAEARAEDLWNDHKVRSLIQTLVQRAARDTEIRLALKAEHVLIGLETIAHLRHLCVTTGAPGATAEERISNEAERIRKLEAANELKLRVEDKFRKGETRSKIAEEVAEECPSFTEAEVDNFLSASRREILESTGPTKKDKYAVLESMRSEEFSSLDYARALNMSPRTAARFVREADGGIDRADDPLRMEFNKGVGLTRLINLFGIKDLEHAVETAEGLFPDRLVFTSKSRGEDRIVAIPNSDSDLSWLDVKDRDFSYHLSDKSNYLFVDLRHYSGERFRLFNLTDVHVGADAFLADLFKSDVEMIDGDPNAYFLLGGDLIDMTTKMSVGQPWDNTMSPNNQISTFAKMVNPIAHKGIAYVSGNHDKGRGKPIGVDLAESLAYYMKIPYAAKELVIQIAIYDRIFTVLLDHGRSGGSTQAIEREAVRHIEKYATRIHARFSGHVHNSQIIEKVYVDVNPGVGLEFFRSFILVGGSHMGYTGTYAEEAGYSPTPQDLLALDIYPDGRYEPLRLRRNPV